MKQKVKKTKTITRKAKKIHHTKMKKVSGSGSGYVDVFMSKQGGVNQA